MTRNEFEKIIETFKYTWGGSNKKLDHANDLKKYVLSKTILSLCDKTVGDKKYGQFTYKHNNRTITFYYTTSRLEPRDLGLNYDYWYEVTYREAPIQIIHNEFRKSKNYWDQSDSEHSKHIVRYLFDNHNKLLTQAIKQADVVKERAKQKGEKHKQNHKLKAAVTFTKQQQVHIATQIYDQLFSHQLKQFEKQISEIFNNDNFQLSYLNYTCDCDNYIVSLAKNPQSVTITADGDFLAQQIYKIKIDHKQLFETWASCDDKILRRFAIKVLDNPVLGLVDADETIRLQAKLTLSNSNK
jgi:hypothetical protein